MTFPVSGVETALWVPPLVGLVISFFTSMAGISGAFLILPFQMSVLGFTSPAVTPTNLVFNVVGIPSAVYRYFKEGRMNWPLAWNIIVGTIPGLIIGLFVRVGTCPIQELSSCSWGASCYTLVGACFISSPQTGERRPRKKQ